MWWVVLGPQSQLGPEGDQEGLGGQVLCPTCRTKPWSLPALHQPPDGLGVHGLNDHFLSLSLSLPAHAHPWICPLGSQTHPFLQLG